MWTHLTRTAPSVHTTNQPLSRLEWRSRSMCKETLQVNVVWYQFVLCRSCDHEILTEKRPLLCQGLSHQRTLIASRRKHPLQPLEVRAALFISDEAFSISVVANACAVSRDPNCSSSSPSSCGELSSHSSSSPWLASASSTHPGSSSSCPSFRINIPLIRFDYIFSSSENAGETSCGAHDDAAAAKCPAPL